MYSANYLPIALLIIGYFSIVQSRNDAAELFREMFLNKRYHNGHSQYGIRRDYAMDGDFLSFSKRVLRIDNEGELREAQAVLFNVNSQSGWILCNYVRPSTVHFSAGGEGGVEELIPYLEDDQIQYALVRLGGIQEKGTLKTTVRDVFITWIGPNVGIIEKGKKAAFLGDIQSYLQPFHADVTVLNKDHLTYETLLDKSNPLSGSHVID